MPDTATTAQTNTEAATEVSNSSPATLLGGDAPATSQKTDATTTAETQTEARVEDKPAAPEKYDFKLPEGYTLDEGALKTFEPILRELNLPNESAQKLVSAYAEMQKVQDQEAGKAFDEQINKWAEETKADKEIGGQAFNANHADAIKAIGKFGTPELKELLNLTGMGNHPEVVRFCMRVGKALKEDSPIQASGTAGGGEKSLEERLWPKQ